MMKASTRFTLGCARNQVAVIISTLESEIGANDAAPYTMPMLQAYEQMDRALRGESQSGMERADWAGVVGLMERADSFTKVGKP